jgi:hypothetical protein
MTRILYDLLSQVSTAQYCHILGIGEVAPCHREFRFCGSLRVNIDSDSYVSDLGPSVVKYYSNDNNHLEYIKHGIISDHMWLIFCLRLRQCIKPQRLIRRKQTSLAEFSITYEGSMFYQLINHCGLQDLYSCVSPDMALGPLWKLPLPMLLRCTCSLTRY